MKLKRNDAVEIKQPPAGQQVTLSGTWLVESESGSNGFVCLVSTTNTLVRVVIPAAWCRHTGPTEVGSLARANGGSVTLTSDGRVTITTPGKGSASTFTIESLMTNPKAVRSAFDAMFKD
jgi:hypothetical protein